MKHLQCRTLGALAVGGPRAYTHAPYISRLYIKDPRVVSIEIMHIYRSLEACTQVDATSDESVES